MVTGVNIHRKVSCSVSISISIATCGPHYKAADNFEAGIIHLITKVLFIVSAWFGLVGFSLRGAAKMSDNVVKFL